MHDIHFLTHLGHANSTKMTQIKKSGVYRNLSKISPPSKIRPPPFFKWSCCKGCFSLKNMPTHLCCSTCCYVKQEAPQKQHEGRHPPLLLLRKQAHDKRGIAESLHVQITRARLTACEVGVFSREISQLSKIHTHPSFRSHLSLLLREITVVHLCTCITSFLSPSLEWMSNMHLVVLYVPTLHY